MDTETTSTVSDQERDDHYFLEQIPESELSTPEDCLQKRLSRQQPEEDSTKEGPSAVVRRVAYSNSDGVDIEAHPTNEKTPLLLW